MKKKFLATFIALLLTLPLVACAESFKNEPIEGIPDPSVYAVVSNGGSAVQFGKYVYYINGYRGYDDEDGKSNYWGNVVKGGLYRAELLEGKDVDFDYMTPFGTTVKLKTYEGGYDAENSFSFVTYEDEEKTGYEKDDDGNIVYDDNGNPVELPAKKVITVSSQRIASKTIGTSGYVKGGIFIYDDFVYYASPSNHQSKDGTFETSKTMFFRTRLDGTQTIRLYTTKSDSSDSAYAFYKQGDFVYLVVQDGTSIISVKVGNKVEQVKELATEVTGVLFPTKSVYYKGIDTNTVDDFIYFTRALTNDDKFEVRSGNVVTAMRPDGSESAIIIANGNNITLKNTDGGYLFYEDNRINGKTIEYTNLHEQFMKNSPSYEKAYQKIVAEFGSSSPLLGHRSGTALNSNIDAYSDIYCFRPNTRSNQVFCLLRGSNKLDLYDGTNFKTIYSGTVSNVYTIQDTNVYFGDGSGKYFRTNAFTPSSENTVVTLGESMTTTASFNFDVVGQFAVMFGEVDEYANDYAFFVDLNKDWNEKQFVGVKSEEDKYDPSVELNPPEEEETENQN